MVSSSKFNLQVLLWEIKHISTNYICPRLMCVDFVILHFHVRMQLSNTRITGTRLSSTLANQYFAFAWVFHDRLTHTRPTYFHQLWFYTQNGTCLCVFTLLNTSNYSLAMMTWYPKKLNGHPLHPFLSSFRVCCSQEK